MWHVLKSIFVWCADAEHKKGVAGGRREETVVTHIRGWCVCVSVPIIFTVTAGAESTVVVTEVFDRSLCE